VPGVNGSFAGAAKGLRVETAGRRGHGRPLFDVSEPGPIAHCAMIFRIV